MKLLVSRYVDMANMVLVNLASEYILNGEYSALASSITVTLFFLGTLFIINARYCFSKK
jgi:VIT1/CCC1 family predicted Fe2+/Mn2+ transporter